MLVGWSVGWSPDLCEKVTLNWVQEYYLTLSNNSSDSSYSSESSESSDINDSSDSWDLWIFLWFKNNCVEKNLRQTYFMIKLILWWYKF